MASLKIVNIHKKFGATHVLKGINLDVNSGEFIVLVGPSGCGKSTLLNLIAGLESTSSGEIYIDNRLMNPISPKDRDIAMVFQSYALYPNMTVRKNISFGLETRKVPKKQIEATVQRVAEMLHIEKFLSRKPRQLSGGQRQRVAMGRALARNPKVFLFDEPLSNLDAKLRVEMRTEIKRLHQRIRTTIVYVTHDQVEAMTLADRIAVMKDGIVQQFGTPAQIYERPVNRFVAGFIGSPSMNFIPCDVVKDDDRVGVWLRTEDNLKYFMPLPIWEKTLCEHIDESVIVGLRPEHITCQGRGEADKGQIVNLALKVKVIEPTGPDTLVIVGLNETDVTCRVHPHNARRSGEVMDLSIDVSQAIIFDPQTGREFSTFA